MKQIKQDLYVLYRFFSIHLDTTTEMGYFPWIVPTSGRHGLFFGNCLWTSSSTVEVSQHFTNSCLSSNLRLHVGPDVLHACKIFKVLTRSPEASPKWIPFRLIDREAGRWIAVPGMNPYEFPCQPGTVILKSSSTFGDVIFRRRSKSYFAGTLNDFFPSGIWSPPFSPGLVEWSCSFLNLEQSVVKVRDIQVSHVQWQ